VDIEEEKNNTIINPLFQIPSFNFKFFLSAEMGACTEILKKEHAGTNSTVTLIDKKPEIIEES